VLLVLVLTVAMLLLVLNGAVALVSAYPHLLVRRAARIDDCPDLYEDVDIGGGLHGWWLAAPHERLAVILVHGWAGNRMERWVPFQALAERLQEAGVSALLFDLGYVGGRRMYSGGARESADVLQAARWVRGRSDQPIVLWGFSAGGHAAILAAQREPELVYAVIADSAFPHSGRIVASRASHTLHIPAVLLGLAPHILSLMTGAPVARLHPSCVPTLLVQGTRDQEVSLGAAQLLSERTDAQLHVVRGAEHEGAFRLNPDAYLETCMAFVDNVGKASRLPRS
jgi:alpha/beta superfamily hydrolase